MTARNQLCAQQCCKVTAGVTRTDEWVFGLVALAVIEAEVDDAGGWLGGEAAEGVGGVGLTEDQQHGRALARD